MVESIPFESIGSFSVQVLFARRTKIVCRNKDFILFSAVCLFSTAEKEKNISPG